MSDISYFIDSDFSDYDSEVYKKEQIKDAFIGAIRSISYDDDGVTVYMGASEPIDGVLVIAAIVYSDFCTVELYKDADDKKPIDSKDVSIDDAVKAFNKFFGGEVPKLSKYKGAKRSFMIETNFSEYPIPVRHKDQIEEYVSMLPCIDDEDCICDDDCCCEAPYVVLIAPDEVKGAEYVQATYDDEEGWYVEISFIDSRRRVNFAEIFGEEAEVIRIFKEFIDGNVPDIDGWTKVKI